MSKKIIITIDDENDITIDTEDYKGPSCVKDIKKLLEDFLEVDDFEHKAEYYESEEEISTGVYSKI